MKISELNKLASIAEKIQIPGGQKNLQQYRIYIQYAEKLGLTSIQAELLYNRSKAYAQKETQKYSSWSKYFIDANVYRYEYKSKYSIHPLTLVGSSKILMFLSIAASLLTVISPVLFVVPVIFFITGITLLFAGIYIGSHTHDDDDINFIFSEDREEQQSTDKIIPANLIEHKKNTSNQHDFSTTKNQQNNASSARGSFSFFDSAAPVDKHSIENMEQPPALT